MTRRLSIFGSGDRVGRPRVRGGVDLRGRGRGRRGGVFPETTMDFLDSLQTRPDPTRPSTSTSEPNFLIVLSRDMTPSALRPDPILESGDAPCWALFISARHHARHVNIDDVVKDPTPCAPMKKSFPLTSHAWLKISNDFGSCTTHHVRFYLNNVFPNELCKKLSERFWRHKRL